MGYFDPTSGDWVEDDEEQFAPALYGGSTNMFMPQGGGVGALFPADFNKYGEMEPYEMADVNQGFTGLKSLLSVLGNPMLNMLIAGQTGADTFDYGAMAGLDPYTGMPVNNQFLGGAGGGGGGGGYQSVYTTDWSDAAANSADPVEKGIYDSIRAGQTPTSVINGLAKTIGDPAELARYGETANAIFDEQAGFRRNQLQGTQAQQTALQQWMAKTGLPDPNAIYGDATTPLPDDVAGVLNPYLTDEAATRKSALAAERNARILDRDAIVKPYEHTPVGVLAPGGGPTKAVGPNFNPPPSAMEQRIADTQRRARTEDRGMDITYSGGGTSSLAPQVNSKAMLDYLMPEHDRGGPMGYLDTPQTGVVTKNGEVVATNKSVGRQRANSAAIQANRERQKADYLRSGGGAAQHNAAVQMLVGQHLAGQGRTPMRDRQNAQLNFIRQLGIGI